MTLRLFVALLETAVCAAACCFVAGVWLYQLGGIARRALT